MLSSPQLHRILTKPLEAAESRQLADDTTRPVRNARVLHQREIPDDLTETRNHRRAFPESIPVYSAFGPSGRTGAPSQNVGYFPSLALSSYTKRLISLQLPRICV